MNIKNEKNLIPSAERADWGYDYVATVHDSDGTVVATGDEKTDYKTAKAQAVAMVAAMLPKLDKDCPLCGGKTLSVGRGREATHRWAKECRRCGWDDDPSLAAVTKAAMAFYLPGHGRSDDERGRHRTHAGGREMGDALARACD